MIKTKVEFKKIIIQMRDLVSIISEKYPTI